MDLRSAILICAAATAGACASTPRSPSEATTSTSSAVPEPTTLSPVIRWTGNLQPGPARSPYVGAPQERAKAFGTVVLSATPDDARRTRAQITFNMPVQAPTELRWALLPGRCGSNAFPLVGFEAFPVIEVGTNGRGQLDAPIPVTIPTEGAYHVNVYLRGQQLDNVVACANVRREGR
jgi:hypothetical protein